MINHTKPFRISRNCKKTPAAAVIQCDGCSVRLYTAQLAVCFQPIYNKTISFFCNSYRSWSVINSFSWEWAGNSDVFLWIYRYFFCFFFNQNSYSCICNMGFIHRRCFSLNYIYLRFRAVSPYFCRLHAYAIGIFCHVLFKNLISLFKFTLFIQDHSAVKQSVLCCRTIRINFHDIFELF